MAHPKGLLIERAQKLGFERPDFNTVKTGPEHEPSFLSDVILDGELLGTGQGTSKRDAERSAAEEALAVLDRREAGEEQAENAKGSAKGGRRRGGRGTAQPQRAAEPEAEPVVSSESDDEEDEDEVDMDGSFTGPWPMVDDLLASVVEVAERRVNADLRGDAALFAIRDFSLKLYKELLADLGEVVEEDEEDEEEDD